MLNPKFENYKLNFLFLKNVDFSLFSAHAVESTTGTISKAG